MPSGERGKEGEQLKATGISNIIIADDFREKGKRRSQTFMVKTFFLQLHFRARYHRFQLKCKNMSQTQVSLLQLEKQVGESGIFCAAPA